MARKNLFLTIATIVLLFAGLVCCLQMDSAIGMETGSGSDDYMPALAGFDREGCERDCQERYGVAPYRRGGLRQRNDYYLYAQCIENCNRAFWKEYDREMRKLEKEKQ